MPPLHYISHFMRLKKSRGIARTHLIFFAVFLNSCLLPYVSIFDILSQHSYYFLFCSTYPPSFSLFRAFVRVLSILLRASGVCWVCRLLWPRLSRVRGRLYAWHTPGGPQACICFCSRCARAIVIFSRFAHFSVIRIFNLFLSQTFLYNIIVISIAALFVSIRETLPDQNAAWIDRLKALS
jgi:hypothetical protein